jgi:hypothetical protein
MPTSFFLVRAVVAEPLRDKFDHWTSTDYLPRALDGVVTTAEAR